MISHSSPVSGVAALGDRFAATAGYDNRLILWDQQACAGLARGYHDHLVNQCAFSPDGRWIASAGSDRTARLWRLPDLKLHCVLPDHDDDVEMVAFHPEGTALATASRDHMVRLFDRSGERLLALRGHEADVLSVQWLDGDRIVSSGDDGTARVWSAQSGDMLEVFDLGGAEADTVVAGPGDSFFVGTDDGKIMAWRGGLAHPVEAHASGVKRLAIDPGCTMLASSSYDGYMVLWSILPDGGIAEIFRTAIPEIVWPRSLCFAGPGRILVGTFGDGYAVFDIRARSWSVDHLARTIGINAICEIGDEPLHVGDSGLVVGGPGRAPAKLGVCTNFLRPFGRTVVAGGHMARLQDALTGETLFQNTHPLNCGVSTSDYAGSLDLFVGTYAGEVLRFRSSKDGRPVFQGRNRLHKNAIKGLACSDDLLFSVSASGDVAFHRLDDLSLVRHVEQAHDKIANGCDVLSDGRFVSISRDRTLRFWTAGGELDEILPTPHTHSIKCVAALRDGRHIATGAYDGRLAVYDLISKAWTTDRRLTNSGISSLWTSADGVLVGSYDGMMRRITI